MKTKRRPIDPDRYAGLQRIAVTLGVFSLLGVVALGQRRVDDSSGRRLAGRGPLPLASPVVPLEEEDDFGRWAIAEHRRRTPARI